MTRSDAITHSADESRARALDAEDPVASRRESFHIPCDSRGEPLAYFAGNSLGLQPRSARTLALEELDDWARYGVDGHFASRRPWFSYHERARESLARLVGAKPGEVVAMNSLTVNLHLLMVSFYQPKRERFRILIEDSAFPSDSHAVASQVKCHGFDPEHAVIRLKPRMGEHALRTEDIEAVLTQEGGSIALVLLGAVNYLTGQFHEMERITRAGRVAGCVVAWDLAHAAGNVPMKLHEWGVDFAVWCSYKYLNAGPGAVAGCFVHERHTSPGAPARPRFEGWWGTDPATRFRMEPTFTPAPGADAWQLSNPPILSFATLLASLSIFDAVGIEALRRRSLALTAFLESSLNTLGDRVRIITPTDPAQRGCQLSIVIENGSRQTQQALHERGVVCDFREPNVIRAAPAPLYNTFQDCARLVRAFSELF